MKKALLYLLIAGLVLSACSAGEKSLVGRWTLTAYGRAASPIPAVADSQASIDFKADGTLSGTSGCNGFGGDYKADGKQITFTGLVSTLMACQEPLMSQEGTMFSVLNGTAEYKIEDNKLTIQNQGIVLVFVSSGQSYPYP